jgi:hypothetical protein
VYSRPALPKVNNLSGGTITGNATGIQAGTLDVTNAAEGRQW